MITILLSALVCLAEPSLAADVGFVLVESGEARAVIVLPSEATEVAKYAAEELKYNVTKASGPGLQTLLEE